METIHMNRSAPPSRPIRILILGGGFAGVYTALHLQRLRHRAHSPIDITLVNRDNYFTMTPLLFEASSGVLEPRHTVNPIRPLLTAARFVEADVEKIDVDRRVVIARLAPEIEPLELEYDHLVIALGGVTNRAIIPGSENGLTFKTLADAIFLRNHIIDLFERADVETDPLIREMLLRFVVVGAGLVGVELIGELTGFVKQLAQWYPNVERKRVSFHLIEAGPKVLPEMERDLAEYAARRLGRRGIDIRINTPVERLEPDLLYLPDGEELAAATIVLATGVAVNPLLQDVSLEKDRKGRICTDGTMLARGRSNIWALGDCASIPDPQGNPYPQLAQHALREARVVAENILHTINGQPTSCFEYQTLGTLAALGHFDGVGRVMQLRLRGFFAWFAWRTYYLFQMPRWERRLRIMLDWTVALLFKNDVVKLDLFGHEHPIHMRHRRPRTRHKLKSERSLNRGI